MDDKHQSSSLMSSLVKGHMLRQMLYIILIWNLLGNHQRARWLKSLDIPLLNVSDYNSTLSLIYIVIIIYEIQFKNIAQIATMSFQTLQNTTLCKCGEWSPLGLIYLLPRPHQRGDGRKHRMKDISNLINICSRKPY